MAFRELVAGGAIGIEIIGFKVAAGAGNSKMSALVLIPVLQMLFPDRGGHIPGPPGIVTASTVVVPPVGVPRVVTVGADVVQALEIGILVTLETSSLTVLAWQSYWMDAQVDLVPDFG
jgi:hypothetical protein